MDGASNMTDDMQQHGKNSGHDVEPLKDLSSEGSGGSAQAASEPVTGYYPPSQSMYPESVSKSRVVREMGQPGRFVFADMSGVLLLVWFPVMVAFFFPFKEYLGDVPLAGSFGLSHLVSAFIIAIGPWFVLLNHLRKGRLFDGIADMILWAIWECLIVITLTFFYKEQAREVFWNASSYWQDMREWLATGRGAEGDPSVWLLMHVKHLAILLVASLFFGLPALIMGVLQLNYMNYYVASCMLASDNPLMVGLMAWHVWSILRVTGYIVLASTVFHCVLGLTGKVHWRKSQFAGGIIVGLCLVILDGILKWQLAETTRQVILSLTGF